MTQPVANFGQSVAFLLGMDQVSFGKHGAAGSYFGDHAIVVNGNITELPYAGQV